MVEVKYSIEQINKDTFHVKRVEGYSSSYYEFRSLMQAVEWIAKDKLDTAERVNYPKYYDEYGNEVTR